jgi:Glycoside hydrolase 123, catalytic domain
MITDVGSQVECFINNISLTGLSRIKSNEFPEDIEQFETFAGTELKIIAAVRDRFPIKNLKAVINSGFSQEIPALPVGMIIFPEEATFLPDPVLEEDSIDVPANTTQSFFLRIAVPANIGPGRHDMELKFYSDTHGCKSKKFSVKVLDISYNNDIDLGASIFWPHWESFCKYYDIELWSEKFWELAESYLAEMKSAGMTGIMATICEDSFRYPLPPELYHYNNFPGMIKWFRNAQGKFYFDYSIYDRYVELNIKLGIDQEIECHALLPCKRQRPWLTYFDEKSSENINYETLYSNDDYIEAWESFFTDFAQHNRDKGWINKITVCPYDEPGNIESFEFVASMVKAIAPEIRITAAMTEEKAIEAQNIVDIATIASVSIDAENTNLSKYDFEPRWYNCCQPFWGNFLFCCPLADAYRISWITAANNFKGFLRWSIIDWTEDPWHQPAFNWPTGDMYLLYPGKNGPATGLRWEAYKTGREDLKLLLTKMNESDSLKAELKKHLDEIGKLGPLSEENTDINTWRTKLFSIIS